MDAFANILIDKLYLEKLAQIYHEITSKVRLEVTGNTKMTVFEF